MPVAIIRKFDTADSVFAWRILVSRVVGYSHCSCSGYYKSLETAVLSRDWIKCNKRPDVLGISVSSRADSWEENCQRKANVHGKVGKFLRLRKHMGAKGSSTFWADRGIWKSRTRPGTCWRSQREHRSRVWKGNESSTSTRRVDRDSPWRGPFPVPDPTSAT